MASALAPLMALSVGGCLYLKDDFGCPLDSTVWYVEFEVSASGTGCDDGYFGGAADWIFRVQNSGQSYWCCEYTEGGDLDAQSLKVYVCPSESSVKIDWWFYEADPPENGASTCGAQTYSGPGVAADCSFSDSITVQRYSSAKSQILAPGGNAVMTIKYSSSIATPTPGAPPPTPAPPATARPTPAPPVPGTRGEPCGQFMFGGMCTSIGNPNSDPIAKIEVTSMTAQGCDDVWPGSGDYTVKVYSDKIPANANQAQYFCACTSDSDMQGISETATFEICSLSDMEVYGSGYQFKDLKWTAYERDYSDECKGFASGDDCRFGGDITATFPGSAQAGDTATKTLTGQSDGATYSITIKTTVLRSFATPSTPVPPYRTPPPPMYTPPPPMYTPPPPMYTPPPPMYTPPPPMYTPPPPAPSTGAGGDSGDSGAPVGAIVGGVVGGLVLIGLIAGSVLFVRHRQGRMARATRGDLTTGLSQENKEEYAEMNAAVGLAD